MDTLKFNLVSTIDGIAKKYLSFSFFDDEDTQKYFQFSFQKIDLTKRSASRRNDKEKFVTIII